MRLLKGLFPFVVALAIALSALAVPAAATPVAPAPVPTWTQGQSVGYGVYYDLGATAETYLKLVESNPSAYGLQSIQELNVTGSLDSWQVDTVSQVTSSYYTLASQAAEGVKLDLPANFPLASPPQAGTYTGSMSYGLCLPPTVPTGAGTVAANLDATILATSSGTSRLQVSNLAYVSVVDNSTFQADIAFSGYHIPYESTNATACTVTVTYENPTFSLTANTQHQVRMLFSPAWDYFNFPITDNKTWWANTTATVGATLSGTINVQGLSSADEASFFDNLTQAFQNTGLTVTGLSSFPIDLSKVSILLGPSYIVNDGVVTDYRVPLDANFRAIASAESLSDGSVHPTYLITDASYECPSSSSMPLGVPLGYAAVYAPDFPASGAGMVVGYQLVVCAGTTSYPAFELKNTSPSTAQQKIGQTETTYQVVPTHGNALVDFFAQPPYLGVLLIVAVVVIVAALLVMRRRHRPAMAPPGTQPPATPPPPSPPPPGSP